MDMRVVLGEGSESLVFEALESVPNDVLETVVFRPNVLKTQRSLAMIPRMCSLVFAVCAGDPWGQRKTAIDAMRSCRHIARHIENVGLNDISHAEVLRLMDESVAVMRGLEARTSAFGESIRPSVAPEMRRMLLRATRRALSGSAVVHRHMSDVLFLLRANSIPLTPWEEQLLLSLSVYG